jgi:hypothetical protein
MAHLTDVRLALVPERFRMEIVPLILWCFVDLHLDAMGVGPGVLTDSRHLPFAVVGSRNAIPVDGVFRASRRIHHCRAPELPVYEQPICPGDGYIWTPGYWAWDGEYYWVPGTWVMAPKSGTSGLRAIGVGAAADFFQ